MRFTDLNGFRAFRKRRRGSLEEEILKYKVNLIWRLSLLEKKQYRYELNAQKLNRVQNEALSTLRDAAELFGGQVTYSQGDQTAEILCTGTECILFAPEIRSVFAGGQEVNLWIEDGQFQLRILYPVMDSIQIADYSEPIRRLQACLRAAGDAAHESDLFANDRLPTGAK